MDTNLQFFDTEGDILKRINELKEQGVSEKDMYVMANQSEDITTLANCTGIDIQQTTDIGIESATKKGIFERFADKLNAHKRIEDAFYRMDLSENQRKKAIEEVRNGKYLLYIDQNYLHNYNEIKNMCTTDCLDGFNAKE